MKGNDLTAAAANQTAALFLKKEPKDEFFWLSQMNKASVITNRERGLLSEETAKKIAKAICQVIENGCKPGALRPSRVIKYEPLLIEAAGLDATMLHVGRSSQDMHATYYSTIMRDNVLALARKLVGSMRILNTLAKDHTETIVPNYTNGVAAQPNSYAHYLQGFLAGFKRDSKRLEQFYERLNLCPMGTTVLNGTGWPLNREKIAEYLGFDGPVEDAYDAAQIKPVDEPTELSSILTSIALHVGTFVQDVSVQYAQPQPWILLQEGGDNTYVSSAMPQKRNPGLMFGVREAASGVLGEAQAAVFRAHNIIPGMIDPKRVPANSSMVSSTIKMLTQFDKMLNALKISQERALKELNSDWTASQEIADVLMREYKLPFRVGHHVASQIVSYAKANDFNPTNFPYAQVKGIYAHVIKTEYPSASEVCPMNEEEFKATLNPKTIIENRRTSGGPQKSQINKAIARSDQAIAEHEAWVVRQQEQIVHALELLDKDFCQLLG